MNGDSAMISKYIEPEVLLDLLKQAEGLSPDTGNGWGFGLSVILIAAGLMIITAIILGRLFIRFLNTLYKEYKESRDKVNKAKAAHAKKLEEKLDSIGKGLENLDNIAQLHEQQIRELQRKQAAQEASIDLLKNGIKPPP